MTACLPLYKAIYQKTGLMIFNLKPAYGKQTRNDLYGREPSEAPEYINEGSRLLDRAKRARGELQNERCTQFIEYLTRNIKNTLISEANLIDKIDSKAKGLAELITLEEVDGKKISERSAASIIGVSQTAYRKTWAERKLRFVKTLY